jgi:hypothetical protein
MPIRWPRLTRAFGLIGMLRQLPAPPLMMHQAKQQMPIASTRCRAPLVIRERDQGSALNQVQREIAGALPKVPPVETTCVEKTKPQMLNRFHVGRIGFASQENGAVRRRVSCPERISSSIARFTASIAV